MNTNKDSAVRCMLTASYVLSTICTIFIFLAIFKRSWNMGFIALDLFLIMGAVIISAFILDDCDEYKDTPLLVCIVSCIVLAIEYFIMVVCWGIFNIVKYIFMFPGTIITFMIDLINIAFFKKGDDDNEKLE